MDLTEDGFQAVLRLGRGDMRRILNILQATSMSHDQVTEKNVYLCTGNPLPDHIKQIMQWLLNSPFNEAYDQMFNLQRLNGYALNDIVQDVYETTISIEWPPQVRMYLFDELAALEHRLASATTESIQIASLVAIYATARSMMTPTES